jgi:hypothetical protein
MKPLYEKNSFPFKKGVWLDFQKKTSCLELQSLKIHHDYFNFQFCQHKYGKEAIEFGELINFNLLDYLFEEITLNKFLLFSCGIKKHFLDLMFLQVGGFNPYDMDSPLFGQYSTESISKNLSEAVEYQKKLKLITLEDKRKMTSPKSMLKFLLKFFNISLAIELWACYKTLLWSFLPEDQKKTSDIFESNVDDEKKDSAIFNPLDKYELQRLFRYFYLFYALIDESRLKRTICHNIKEAATIFEICLEKQSEGSVNSKMSQKLLIKFYRILIKEFNYKPL